MEAGNPVPRARGEELDPQAHPWGGSRDPEIGDPRSRRLPPEPATGARRRTPRGRGAGSGRPGRPRAARSGEPEKPSPGVAVTKFLIPRRGSERASGRLGRSFERVYLRTLQAERARETVGFPARQQIFASERKTRSRAAPPSPSPRSRGAGLGGPGLTVKDRNEAGDLRGWGRGGRRATAKARNWSAAPRPRRAGAGGGETPSLSSSINLPWLRSVNKNGVNQPWSLRAWGGSGGQRCRGRRRRPCPAPFAPGRSASPRPAASSSRGARRGPAGPFIGCLHFNSGHCWSN